MCRLEVHYGAMEAYQVSRATIGLYEGGSDEVWYSILPNPRVPQGTRLIPQESKYSHEL